MVRPSQPSNGRFVNPRLAGFPGRPIPDYMPSIRAFETEFFAYRMRAYGSSPETSFRNKIDMRGRVTPSLPPLTPIFQGFLPIGWEASKREANRNSGAHFAENRNFSLTNDPGRNFFGNLINAMLIRVCFLSQSCEIVRHASISSAPISTDVSPPASRRRMSRATMS